MEHNVKSPLGTSAGPGERPSVGAGLVRNKQAAAPAQHSPGQAQQPGHRDQTEVTTLIPSKESAGVGGEVHRVLQTAPGTDPPLSLRSLAGSPHSALSSAQAT